MSNIMPIDIKTEIPGPNARKWLERYEKHAAESTYCYPFVWDVTKHASGPYCSDPDGNIFLDFYGHVASAPLGYNHPKILIDCGVPFDPIKIAGHDTYIAVGSDPETCEPLSIYPYAEDFRTATHLQEKLIEITQEFGFDRVFLVNSGAEAVENAIKISQYKKYTELKEKLASDDLEDMFRQLGIRPDATIEDLYEDYPLFGIACTGAFHGRTLNALTHNKSKKVQKEGFPTIRWVRHVPYPTVSSNMELNEIVDSRDLTTLIKSNDLARIVFEERKIPKDLLAYVITEPVLGEGGYIIPSKEKMQELYNLARHNNALFISDEIQTGLGRTGKMWAIEHFGIKPDVIASAKALRLGAVISKKENFPDRPGVLSSTWSGGEIAVAIGYKTIEIIQEEKLVENAMNMGSYLVNEFDKYRHDSLVTEVRQIGLMIGFDFVDKETRNYVVESCFKNGLLTLGCGERTLRMLPPLNVTTKDIDEAMKVFGRIVKP